jgi:hypothetical protein
MKDAAQAFRPLRVYHLRSGKPEEKTASWHNGGGTANVGPSARTRMGDFDGSWNSPWLECELGVGPATRGTQWPRAPFRQLSSCSTRLRRNFPQVAAAFPNLRALLCVEPNVPKCFRETPGYE